MTEGREERPRLVGFPLHGDDPENVMSDIGIA